MRKRGIHTQKAKKALKPKATEMMTWTLKLRWLLFLNWSPQEGFLETLSDIRELACRGLTETSVRGNDTRWVGQACKGRVQSG